MSNALAIGAVTAVLKNLLDNAVVNEKLTNAVGPVKVSALPPDKVKDITNFLGLNLFLYQVQPNPGWRNAGLPSRDPSGARISNAPLALDLFYLLTAWGTQDFEAEILLGYAMQLFHEMPVLTRDVIRKTFENPNPVVTGNALPPKFKDLAAAALADQFEVLKITPHWMSTEETSKFWTAIQVYRPSIAYHVSVVLIESEARTHSTLPVLTRDIGVQADTLPPFPTLLSVAPIKSQPAARLGENVTLTGHRLDGVSVSAVLRHPHAASLPAIGPLASVTPNQAIVPLPNNPAVWPAGNYTIALVVTGAVDRVSNALPLAVAPVINIGATTSARDGDQNLTVTLKCTPNVLPHQTATLILGDASANSDAHDTATDTLTFKFPKADAPPAGAYPVRLRIDGVESLLIDRSKTPPEFDPTQQLTIP